METENAPPPPRRKRRRPRKSPSGPGAEPLPLTVITVVFGSDPFVGEAEADRWLAAAGEDEQTDRLLDEARSIFDQAAAAAAATTGKAVGEPLRPDDLSAVRIGYGDGGEVYDGRWQEAIGVDATGGAASRRQERRERIIPLPRIAAILGNREPIFTCELMVPRVRADLDAGRLPAAALGIHDAARATIAEMEFTLEDPDHQADVDQLATMLPVLAELAEDTLSRLSDTGRPEIPTPALEQTSKALNLAERLLRRYRVSRQ